MPGPIDSVYVDGVPVEKGNVRANDKTSIRRNIADVSTVQSTSLSGQFAGIYIRSLQANFDLDTGDATTPDNGTTCIIDADGNRFKIVAGSGGGDVAGETHAAASKSTPVDADELPLVDSAASNVLKKLTWANLKAAIASYLVSAGLIREKLTVNRTYYVRTDGSDSNNGLANTSGGAFLTLQKAIDTVAMLDLSIYNVTIQVGAGTYTSGLTVNGAWVGAGTVTLTGDTTTPANCIINVTGATAVNVTGGGRLSIGGFKLSSTSSGNLLNATSGGMLTVTGAMEFGATTSAHIGTSQYGQVVISGVNYTISAGALRHFSSGPLGYINVVNATVTITGTPAFSSAFAFADRLGFVTNTGVTYSGLATGVRYVANSNAVVNSNGGGANFFPGNSAGTTATGGQYL